MSNKPRYQNEDWLREQYYEKELTQAEIAEQCSGARRTISEWMNRYDIETERGGGFVTDDEPPFTCECGAGPFLKIEALQGHRKSCDEYT